MLNKCFLINKFNTMKQAIKMYTVKNELLLFSTLFYQHKQKVFGSILIFHQQNIIESSTRYCVCMILSSQIAINTMPQLVDALKALKSFFVYMFLSRTTIFATESNKSLFCFIVPLRIRSQLFTYQHSCDTGIIPYF